MTAATHKVLGATAAGLGLGVSWGIVARVWMRLISTDPEFSVAGTAMILVLTGISGLVLGFLNGVRRTGRSRWWRILAVFCLPTFASPGMIFLPAFLLGGLLFIRRWWARAIGVAGIALAQAGLWVTTREDSVNPWVLHGGFLLLSLSLAAGAAELYRPTGSGEAAVAEEELAVDPLAAG